MTHSHRWVEKRAGLNIFYQVCRDCGAQSDELPFEEEVVVVAVSSHRARQKLFEIVGKDPGYWAYASTGAIGAVDYHKVPAALAKKVLAIKSIREVKAPPELRRRWTV